VGDVRDGNVVTQGQNNVVTVTKNFINLHPGLSVLLVLLLGMVIFAALFSYDRVVAYLNNRPIFPIAKDGETLLILAPYQGEMKALAFAPERQVREALQTRLQRLALQGIAARLEERPEPFDSARQARQVGERYRAALVVWGEFDDLSGVRTFVEIIPPLPQPEVQQSGELLPLAPLDSQQAELGRIPPACLQQGLPQQADALATLSLGLLRLGQQDYGGAESYFSQALEAAPGNSACPGTANRAYYWRGLASALQERFPQARQDLDRAVAMEPDFALALAQRGAVSLALGDPAAAQQDYQASLEQIYPEDQAGRAVLLGNLGLALEQQGQYRLAEVSYRQALALDQARKDTAAQALDWLHLGSLALRQEQLSGAEAGFKQAFELYRQAGSQRGQAAAQGNLGLLSFHRQDYAAARAAFQHALEMDRANGYRSGEARQLLRLGLVDLREQQVESARQQYSAALAIYQSTGSPYGQAMAYIGLGLVENELGDQAAALEALQTALRLLEATGSPEAETVKKALPAG
jgi:tetratricopeptide (TPR) repeat protein